jgi:DNA-binding response OmpR family regulator
VEYGPGGPTELSGPGERWVVLVEDDPAIAQMYRFGLERHGFRVTVAATGEAMFGSINGTAPDVIILDYQLPVENGDRVLERIRRDARVRGVRVFMLSNFPPTHDGAIDRVFKLGAIAWLEKSKTPPARLADKLVEAFDAVHARVDL